MEKTDIPIATAQHVAIATAVIATPIDNNNNYAFPNSSQPPVNATSTTTTTTETIPLAPALLNYDDTAPDVQEREVSQKAAFGSDTGRIAALQEKMHIRNQNRTAPVKHVQTEANRIENATRVARQRDRVTARDNAAVAREITEECAVGVSIGTGVGVGVGGRNEVPPVKDFLDEPGYKVGEYNVESFKCDEYESTYEYKSVYD